MFASGSAGGLDAQATSTADGCGCQSFGPGAPLPSEPVKKLIRESATWQNVVLLIVAGAFPLALVLLKIGDDVKPEFYVTMAQVIPVILLAAMVEHAWVVGVGRRYANSLNGALAELAEIDRDTNRALEEIRAVVPTEKRDELFELFVRVQGRATADRSRRLRDEVEGVQSLLASSERLNRFLAGTLFLAGVVSETGALYAVATRSTSQALFLVVVVPIVSVAMFMLSAFMLKAEISD